MTKIFISYRREDSSTSAGRLYDQLVARFGKGEVFKDVDSIAYGQHFPASITRSITQSPVFLAIIGPSWARVEREGRRRLDDPQDYVRREVESALTQSKVVIPVLVQGAKMPRRDELPPTLQELVELNAFHVRDDPDFHNDMKRLISTIEKQVPSRAAQVSALLRQVSLARLLQIALVLAGVIALALIFSVIARALLLLLASVMLAYAFHPLYRQLRKWLPSALATFVVLALLVGAGVVVGYGVLPTASRQMMQLAILVRSELATNPATPAANLLENIGLTSTQIDATAQEISNTFIRMSGQIVPTFSNVLDAAMSAALGLMMWLYLLIDGERLAMWLQRSAPRSRRQGLTAFVGALDRIVGDYLRSELILALLVGSLVGGGMALLRVPYAVLLGVLAFALEYLPIVGMIVSGVICVLVALTQGWLIAVFTLVYILVVHIIESDIIGPRIVGRAIGLHPIVSLVAIAVGAQFGVWGILLAAPIAGFGQALLIDRWIQWRRAHADEFAEDLDDVSSSATPLPIAEYLAGGKVTDDSTAAAADTWLRQHLGTEGGDDDHPPRPDDDESSQGGVPAAT